MINAIKRLFSRRWMDWSEYKAKVDFRDMYYFQQKTRKESIRNSPFY